MKLDFTQITKLVCLLAKEDIPFELVAGPILTHLGDDYPTAGMQVIIKSEKYGRPIIDAVINCMSYGHEGGLIEIMAHGLVSEITNDDVIGWLTGEEAFEFMKKAYNQYNELTRVRPN